MWQATIQNKSVNTQGNFNFTVVYSNGTRTVSEQYNISTSTQLNTIIQTRLTALNGIDQTVQNVPIGVFTPTVAPVDPQIAIFQSALSLLEQYQHLLDLGVLTTSDAGYQTALANAQKNYTVSYFNQ